MMAIMYFANRFFYGRILGTLPFEPWGLVSNMSHRGLYGEDKNEYSCIFIYILAQMAFRGTIAKLMGTEGPRLPIEHQTPKWLQDMANPEKNE
jgi:hypothetical protein